MYLFYSSFYAPWDYLILTFEYTKTFSLHQPSLSGHTYCPTWFIFLCYCICWINFVTELLEKEPNLPKILDLWGLLFTFRFPYGMLIIKSKLNRYWCTWVNLAKPDVKYEPSSGFLPEVFPSLPTIMFFHSLMNNYSTYRSNFAHFYFGHVLTGFGLLLLVILLLYSYLFLLAEVTTQIKGNLWK